MAVDEPVEFLGLRLYASPALPEHCILIRFGSKAYLFNLEQENFIEFDWNKLMPFYESRLELEPEKP